MRWHAGPADGNAPIVEWTEAVLRFLPQWRGEVVVVSKEHGRTEEGLLTLEKTVDDRVEVDVLSFLGHGWKRRTGEVRGEEGENDARLGRFEGRWTAGTAGGESRCQYRLVHGCLNTAGGVRGERL